MNLSSPLGPAASAPPPLFDRGQAGLAPPPPPVDDGDEIDLRALLRKLWRGKWIIAVTTVAAASLALVAALMATPVYTASAKILFDVPQLNVVNVEELLISGDRSRDGVTNEMEVLRSTRLAAAVIETLDLQADPAVNPALRPASASLLDRIRGFAVDGLRAVGALPPPDAGPVDLEERARRDVMAMVDYLRGGLALRPVAGSRVVELSFTAGDPRRAAAIANAYAEQYLAQEVAAKREAARGATEWLRERVVDLQGRVEAAETAVEAARAAVTEAAGQSARITAQQLDALNAAFAAARAERLRIQTRHERVAAALAEGDGFAAISDFRAGPLFATLLTERRALEQRRAALLATQAVDSAAVAWVDEALARLDAEMAGEAARVVEALGADLAIARAQEAALAAEVDRLERSVIDQSAGEVRLRQLEREAEASRGLYENFLIRFKETDEQQALQGAEARILSPAEPPLAADARGRSRMVLLAAFGGGLLGVGVVFLLDRLNATFRGVDELEAETGLTVLGALPTLGADRPCRAVLDYVRGKPGSRLAEAVRNLRTSILFGDLERPPQVVMFTSATPKEAKSTTALLVALTSRQMGRSTVIVDCDLRLPALSALFDADARKSAGLLALLAGRTALDEAVIQDEETGLHALMVCAGDREIGLNAADALSSPRFAALIEELRGRYDLVVLDTPPSLAVADPRIIAASADAVVFAVRWGQTARDVVAAGLRELLSVRAPVLGLALTMVDEARAAGYGARRDGYYRNRYGAYFKN